MRWRVNPDRGTTNWRAVCGRTGLYGSEGGGTEPNRSSLPLSKARNPDDHKHQRENLHCYSQEYSAMSRVNHTWDEIAVGDAGELTRVCTSDDIVVFVLASGNYSPAHLAPTPEAVAPSMWVGSLFSSVLGNVL